MKARYQQLEAVRVKGRQTPVDIFEVTSLHAEATGQRFALSPLGPQPLPPVPPAAKAAAAAVGAGLVRRGSGALPGAGNMLGGEAAADGGRQQAGPALSLELSGAGQVTHQQQQQQQQQGEAAGGPASSGLLQTSDRVLSIASTSAAPIQLANHTPMIGEEGCRGASLTADQPAWTNSRLPKPCINTTPAARLHRPNCTRPLPSCHPPARPRRRTDCHHEPLCAACHTATWGSGDG